MNTSVRVKLLTVATIAATLASPSLSFASESPPGGSSGGGGGSGGSNGGYSGAEMTRLMTIAKFSMKHNYPALIDRRPTPKTITGEEQKFLCSMAKIRVNRPDRVNDWFPAFLGTLLGRTANEIRTAMKSVSCGVRR